MGSSQNTWFGLWPDFLGFLSDRRPLASAKPLHSNGDTSDYVLSVCHISRETKMESAISRSI